MILQRTAMLAALAQALLSLAALPAGEAAAQGFPDPSTPGVWGTAYADLAEGQLPRRLIETDSITCLAEPSVVTPDPKGYRLTSYIIDPEALAADEAVYYHTFESLCRFDAASGIETCQDASGADPVPYYTYFEALDAAAGIYRGHFLEDRRDVVRLKTQGTLPEETYPFVVFLCPKEMEPRAALLAEARHDPTALDVLYTLVEENILTCGLALCGGEVKRAQDLTR